MRQPPYLPGAGAIFRWIFSPSCIGRAVADDLDRYNPEELAALAEQSWSFLLERKPGAPKIAFTSARSAHSLAVLEILNDDMPFLVDSVLGEISERALDIRLLVHPVFTVERDEAGRLTAFKGTHKGEGRRESFIHIHIAGLDDDGQRAEIVAALEEVLADVRVAVADWRPMLARASDVAAELKANPPPLPAEEIAEAIQFLQWIAADNFTLLGVRDYGYTDSEHALEPKFETGLGLLRSHEMRLLRRGDQLVTITPEIREFLKEPKLLIMTKAAARSRVHRRVYLDYIGVKRFDPDGKLVGECVLCGLLTSTAYTRSVRAIPYLRRKVDRVISRAGFDPSSHSGKALVNVLETLSARRTVPDRRGHALRVRARDPAARRAPARARAAAARSLRPLRIGSGLHPARPLRQRDQGEDRRLSGHDLQRARARLLSVLSRKARWCACTSSSGATRAKRRIVDRAILDRAVEAIVRSWTDGLREALAAAHPPQGRRARCSARYRDAFPVDYREVYPAASRRLRYRASSRRSPPSIRSASSFIATTAALPARAGLKVLSRSRPIPLSERVPVLENMGFRVVDERTYHIAATRRRRRLVSRHDARKRVGPAGRSGRVQGAAREPVSSRSWADAPRTTAITRWCSPPDWSGATSR